MTEHQPFPDGDRIIMCHPGTDAPCELCGEAVAATPESIAKSKLPGWHLICRTCAQTHILSKGHTVLFKGRFRDSAGAKRVLPR